ncbi:MAG: thiamine-phosphate kinase [Chloroflexi bacterium]|nr:thiamine-phosphate kinase [Chloroflexota bacterium]
MLVRELGEFGLIARLSRRVSASTAGASQRKEPPLHVRVGIGDDAAVWDTAGAAEALTTDTIVDGTHFTLATTGWDDLGWKALATNLSDIAAMGARPGAAVVTLGLPPDTRVEDIDALYDGLLEAAAEFGASVAGGDVVASPTLFITVALTGTLQHEPMLRSAARPGDLIAVTGSLGASAAGLAVLQGASTAGRADAKPLLDAHRRPWPRVAEGAALAEAGVLSAMDITDGLVDDLGKLCAAAGCAARLDAACVPVHAAALAAFPDEAMTMALNGGEDYELLFTAPPRLMASIGSGPACGVHVVGEIISGTSGEVVVVDDKGNAMAPPRKGWDHFG